MRNAPGTAPSAACRRNVRAAMPSTCAASERPMDRRLSRGERIICPPTLRPWRLLLACMPALPHEQFPRRVCSPRYGRKGPSRHPLGYYSFVSTSFWLWTGLRLGVGTTLAASLSRTMPAGKPNYAHLNQAGAVHTLVTARVPAKVPSLGTLGKGRRALRAFTSVALERFLDEQN